MELLGIDIGGTGIKGAVVDTRKGALVSDRHRLVTPKGARPEPVAETVAKHGEPAGAPAKGRTGPRGRGKGRAADQ